VELNHKLNLAHLAADAEAAGYVGLAAGRALSFLGEPVNRRSSLNVFSLPLFCARQDYVVGAALEPGCEAGSANVELLALEGLGRLLQDFQTQWPAPRGVKSSSRQCVERSTVEPCSALTVTSWPSAAKQKR
jgi:hypothetical protein